MNDLQHISVVIPVYQGEAHLEALVKELSDYYIEIPEVKEMLVPILATVPLQLLAYHIAINRGCNVDQPRNLAKSVTVE